MYFKEKQCDVVLLEAGLGGRLDCTNVIVSSLLSVITGIDLDHTEYLGDTCEKIAAEKAGIIKENCPVFSAPQQPEVVQVLRKTAKEKQAGITFVDGEKFQIREEKPGELVFSCCLENRNEKEQTVCELTTLMS